MDLQLYFGHVLTSAIVGGGDHRSGALGLGHHGMGGSGIHPFPLTWCQDV